MSATKLSPRKLDLLWKVSLQSGLIGRLDEPALSAHLGLPADEVRQIVMDLVELGVYDPTTRQWNISALPKMKWSEPMTGEELDAHIQQLSAKAALARPRKRAR